MGSLLPRVALASVILNAALHSQYPGGHLEPAQSLSGQRDGEGYGTVLAELGDLDRDGLAEIAIAAPWHGRAGGPAGRVEIRRGGSLELLRSHEAAPGTRGYGAAIAAADDQDGDGVEDYLVGAPGSPGPGGPRAGALELRSGRDGSLLRRWTGEGADDALGTSLGVLDDLDGDGRAEIVAGAPWAEGLEPGSGAVLVYSSRDGSVLHRLPGARAGDAFGLRLARIGDTDGDGRPDLLVASPTSPTRDGGRGRVHLYSGRSGRLLRELAASGADRTGFLMEAAGDFDGDGSGDFLLGSPGAACGEHLACGRLQLRSGRDLGLLLEIHGREGFERFPACARMLPDLDGDGLFEIAAGSPRHGKGEIRIFRGADGSLLDRIPGKQEGEGFGSALLPLLDAEGELRLLASAPFAGTSARRPGEVRVLEHHRLLTASATSLSASAGGSIAFLLDAGPECAGLPYTLILSRAPGRTLWMNAWIPLEEDDLFRATARGRQLPGARAWTGLLDARGQARPSFHLDGGRMDPAWTGRTFYLAAAVGLETPRARASRPLPLSLEP